MLILLALAAAGAAPAGCFNGGALVGAQAGFSHIIIKRLAKDKAISKDDATKVIDAIIAAAGGNVDLFTADSSSTDTTKITDDKADVYVSVPKGADADKIAQATADELSKLKSNSKLTISSITYKIDAADNWATYFDATGKAASVLKDAFAKTVLTDFAKNKDALVKTRVNDDAEMKYTSNNGFAGLHVGYLGRVNEKFLVGGLVEGNWVFGQDMKVDSTAEKDTSARFNANLFLRAMFNLTGNFMAGADLGVAFQEIRTLKEVGKTDKESKWFWGPAARLVLGVALTDNILATAHFGGVFPIKQDHFRKDFKAKYSNFHGGVGISYAFGG